QKNPIPKPTFLPNKPPPALQRFQPQEFNKLKKYNIVIGPRLGSPKPFEGKANQEFNNKINKALFEINSKYENNPIQIKDSTRYASGNIKLFTKTRHGAAWLLNYREEWTHLAESTFVTSPTLIPVIAHSCPAYLDLDDNTNSDNLLKQNEIEKKM
ncbi:hypothetical protein O181_027637, partial [Austropuccinia psidii MF-1]|nr:hypothetical protein [Austropuccinia psidii MF-1]